MKNNTFIRFIIVGIINTIVGTTVMLIAYNLLHFSYWLSSFLNYFIGSIVSFMLNKYFTFKTNDNGIKEIFKFTINIIICYLISYSISKIFVSLVFSTESVIFIDNLSMLFGMVLFVIINYIGQRFWVFKANSK